MRLPACLVLLVCVACNTFRDPPAHTSLPLPDSETITVSSIGTNVWCHESIKHFYRLQDAHLFWSGEGELYPVADSLLGMIAKIDSYGLMPGNYHAEMLKVLISDTTMQGRFQHIDVLLTDAYLSLFSHLRDGVLDARTLQLRDLSSIVDSVAIKTLRKLDANSLRSSLEDREPSFPQYQELKRELRDMLVSRGKDMVGTHETFSLMVNLERWRWEKPWPDRYVAVNVPAFTMRVVEEDSTWLETKVIVGKRTTPTPIMESVITSFIIYPYWHVPRSIATKEILPALQTDHTYLERNNFQVLDKAGSVIQADTIQWRRYGTDYFPFVLRQREGSENSMGIIKFNFANRYGVYLHDTNSRRLFQRTRRDLSHGCVRVNNAVAFARYLLKDDDIYVSPEDLDQYLSLRQRLKIDLRDPIALKLTYFTAEVSHGELVFHEDVYKKDSVMVGRLFLNQAQAVLNGL